MTISLAEARELSGPAGPVPREAAERVLDYLVFHRSLLGEQGTGAPLLERYLGLVRGLKEGVHVVIADPFQKATAMLFELVMDEAFDPWEIDLARFTQLYVERVRKEGRVDFAVAGRLLYMAWSILYLQSRELLAHRENPEPELPDGVGDAVIDPVAYDDVATEESVGVTSTMLDPVAPSPLEPIVGHPESRPVSLQELVQAFGEAEEEARRSLRIQELRERLREQQRAPPEVLVHGDIPLADVQDLWSAAQTHALGTPFPFLELWRDAQGRDRLVALFLAALYLAKENVLELRQERLADSPLLLVRTQVERPTTPTPEAGS